jgi:hypothetical protein
VGEPGKKERERERRERKRETGRLRAAQSSRYGLSEEATASLGFKPPHRAGQTIGGAGPSKHSAI